MKKICKPLLIAAAGFFVYLVCKTIHTIKKVSKLERDLVTFLTEVYQRVPKVSISVAANFKTVITIKVSFPPAILENSPDLEDDIREYIAINYSCLAKHRIIIQIKADESE